MELSCYASARVSTVMNCVALGFFASSLAMTALMSYFRDVDYAPACYKGVRGWPSGVVNHSETGAEAGGVVPTDGAT